MPLIVFGGTDLESGERFVSHFCISLPYVVCYGAETQIYDD